VIEEGVFLWVKPFLEVHVERTDPMGVVAENVSDDFAEVSKSSLVSMIE